MNKYLYTHGNPINSTDPTGQFSILEVSAISAIIGLSLYNVAFFGSGSALSTITRIELHYFYGIPYTASGPVHVRIVLLNGANGLAFDGDPSTTQPLTLISKDPEGKPLRVGDSFYNSSFNKEPLTSVLPYLYLKQSIQNTMKWVNLQRFRYILGLKSVNSNSVASQVISDLGFYRSEVNLPFAPGWQTDLRNESLTLERNS